MMDRQIVSFEIPTLSIALARLDEPRLQTWPVAVAHAPTPRTVLQEVSSEAQRDGVCAGMSVGHARRLCPPLRVLAPDPVRIRAADDGLFSVVAQFSPVWEPRRPGHWFLDLTGTTRLFGLATDTAARIEREVESRYGLSGVVGVANTKLVSHIAAKVVAPLQLCEVCPGSERDFLSPLPVTTLPGLGRFPKPTIVVTLEDLNIITVGELAEIAQHHLEDVLGGDGLLLHAWAQGVDPSPVLPPLQRSRLDASLTLKADVVDDGVLLGMLYGLLERLCRTLRAQQRVCHMVTLNLRYSDHAAVQKQQTLSTGTHWEGELFPYLQMLLQHHFRRRVRVRSVTLGVEELTPQGEQLSLFQKESHLLRPHRVAVAMDRLRERFGEGVIWFGRTHH